MAHIGKKNKIRQNFYKSNPAPCPYLPDQVERKLFTVLEGHRWDKELNSILTEAGFRRSHDVIYRPICDACQACVPVRIRVQDFTASKSQKRCLKGNLDLTIKMVPSHFSQEHFDLFTAYQKARHTDSEMAEMSADDFAAMLHEGSTDTYLFELRNEDKELLGAILADRVKDGYSAIYSYFISDAPKRSLGTFLILALIGLGRKAGLDYIYLGYTIKSCDKMAYKTKFKPCELLGPNGWQ